MFICFELTAEEFNDYLEHDGVTDVLERRRSQGQLTSDARERYSKHVKAIVQVGEPRSGAEIAKVAADDQVMQGKLILTEQQDPQIVPS